MANKASRTWDSARGIEDPREARRASTANSTAGKAAEADSAARPFNASEVKRSTARKSTTSRTSAREDTAETRSRVTSHIDVN